jgi:hypothetical protein
MRWKPPALAGFMPQYAGYEIPPEQNANMAFILSGLSWIEDRAVFILPNNVLATEQKQEKAIKQSLIRQNLLLAVVSLPGNMFESTSIPTCILVFDKHKTTRKIAMIDLRDKCMEEVRDQRGQFGGNSHTGRTYHKTVIAPPETMQECLKLIEHKQDKENLCKWVRQEDLERTGWNLTPGRYIDMKIEEAHRSFEDIANDYNRVIRQKNAIKIRMNRTAAKRLGYDCMNIEEPDITASFGIVGQKVLKEDNISFGADNGIKIQISTKDGIHPLILDFLNHWKQMIIFLNEEENRYLAEFRDALIPKLMNGEINVSNTK